MKQHMKLSSVALAVSAFLWTGIANAQEKLDRVTVTGSSIKRVDAEGSLPVQTFSQQDIIKSGVTSVTDFIQQLPVMQGFSVAADSVGGGGGGITTASIHDVGEQYTLVLLNGRRIAPANSGTTIDLNSIPLSAIERIEVLTDGASALYGADAIAGVVNFILKKGAAPFQIALRLEKPQHGGAEGLNFNVSKGFGNFERDGFSLYVSYAYDKTKQLKANQRDFAKTGIINFTDQQGRALSFFNGSSRSVPPNVDVRYANPSPTQPNRVSTVSFSPYAESTGNCAPDHVALGRQCFFDYTSTVEIVPEQKRNSFFASGEMKLGGSGLKGFADFAYIDAHILARIAPYPAEFSLATTHPYFSTYVNPYLTQAQRDNLKSVNVKYRLYDMGNRGIDYGTKATHLVAGVEGNVGAWDINSAFTISNQKQNQDYVSGFPLADKFNAAIDAQLFDPFLSPLGTMPADQLAALNATQYVGNYNTTDIKMVGLDARAQTELFKMAGGSAQLSFGGELRQTGYKVSANQAVANAEILFDDPQAEYDLQRKNGGVFAEMLFPISNKFEVSGALRYDTFTGVDDKTRGTTFGTSQGATTYKIMGKFKATKNLALRASYGTGFRVATMTNIAQPLVDFGVTGGSYACPFSATYDPLGYIAKGYVCDNLQKEVFQGGNPELKPEHSKQWNLGVVWDITDNVTSKFDLWSVNINDAVTEVSERLILSNPGKYLNLYTTKFKSSNNLTYVAVKLLPINIGKVENQGLDWSFTFRNKFEFGRLTTNIAGSHLIKSRYTTPGTDDQFETSLGEFGSNDAVSFRDVITANASLVTGAWTNSLTMNFRSGYKDIHHDVDNCNVDDGTDCVDTQLDVPRYTTFNWQTQWEATKNVGLMFGVTNLFDRKPPLSLRNTGSHQLGYDPRYASPIGRSFYLQASYKF